MHAKLSQFIKTLSPSKSIVALEFKKQITQMKALKAIKAQKQFKKAISIRSRALDC